MHYELVRGADVQVRNVPGRTRTGASKPRAEIIINDRKNHIFPTESRVSKALELMSPEQLGERLTGGHFFFVGGNLVDFRDGQYSGFVHEDESIARLVDTLGIIETKSFGAGARLLKGNTHAGGIVLGKVWSRADISIPGYHAGGEFNSQLIFIWNPFVRSVNTLFQLIRLICTNGMVGMTSFLNSKVPLINRWEEHLEIANRQIQNKVESIAVQRFQQMGRERASVSELFNVYDHILTRRKSALEHGYETEALQLNRMSDIVNPVRHLRDYYREHVFEDRRLAAQLPGHLSAFDLYNIATEVRSHTTECEDSTNRALDRFSNALMFDREDITSGSAQFMAPPKSQFSDPDEAFFGKVH